MPDPRPAPKEPLPPRIKRVSEYLSDVVNLLGTKSLPEAVDLADPLTEAVLEAAKGSFAWVRFATKVYDNLHGRDGEAMLAVLCHTAYIQAVATHLRPLAIEVPKRLSAPALPEEIGFSSFTLEGAQNHPFVVQTSEQLRTLLRDFGVPESQGRETVGAVNRTFISNIRRMLADRRYADRFPEAAALLGFGGREFRAYEVIEAICEAQIAEFTEAPLTKQDSFSLADVFVEPIADLYNWQTFFGVPRQEPLRALPLIESLLDTIADRQTPDLLMIQGPAGAGKSSLTLRLCQRLQEEGLRALRVRLRDLDPSRSVEDAIEDALGKRHDFRTKGVLLDGDLFDEATEWRGRRISRYVLILDGWDELTVGADRSFAASIDRMLTSIAHRFRDRRIPVAVVITGRPTHAIGASHALPQSTPIFDLVQFDPPRVRELADKLKAVQSHLNLPQIEALLNAYERHYNLLQGRTKDQDPYRIREQSQEVKEAGMDILGLPLLLFLTIRIAATWTGPIEELIERPTNLYRHLIDTTCATAGRRDEPEDLKLIDDRSRVFLRGDRLRKLLQATAVAMTAARSESLTYAQLKGYLDILDPQLIKETEIETGDDALTSLVVSYYFRSGNHKLGVEFLHKSFREYLFAEAILTTLKDHPGGKSASCFPSFDKWSLAVLRLFAGSWTSAEVSSFFDGLLTIEIAEAREDDASISLEEWQHIASKTATLWLDWSFGHQQSPLQFMRLIEWCSKSAYEQDVPIIRATDAHLGDGLFRVTSSIHRQLIFASGWPTISSIPNTEKITANLLWENTTHTSQSSIAFNGYKIYFFAPVLPLKWAQIAARINSIERPDGPFPIGIDCAYLDLRGARIELFLEATFNGQLSFRGCFLQGVQLRGSFVRTSFADAFAEDLSAIHSNFESCNFQNASLLRANFLHARFLTVDFNHAHLTGAKFLGSNTAITKFANANLTETNFKEAHVRDSWFTDSDRTGWDRTRATFQDCFHLDE